MADIFDDVESSGGDIFDNVVAEEARSRAFGDISAPTTEQKVSEALHYWGPTVASVPAGFIKRTPVGILAAGGLGAGGEALAQGYDVLAKPWGKEALPSAGEAVADIGKAGLTTLAGEATGRGLFGAGKVIAEESGFKGLVAPTIPKENQAIVKELEQAGYNPPMGAATGQTWRSAMEDMLALTKQGAPINKANAENFARLTDEYNALRNTAGVSTDDLVASNRLMAQAARQMIDDIEGVDTATKNGMYEALIAKYGGGAMEGDIGKMASDAIKKNITRLQTAKNSAFAQRDSLILNDPKYSDMLFDLPEAEAYAKNVLEKIRRGEYKRDSVLEKEMENFLGFVSSKAKQAPGNAEGMAVEWASPSAPSAPPSGRMNWWDIENARESAGAAARGGGAYLNTPGFTSKSGEIWAGFRKAIAADQTAIAGALSPDISAAHNAAMALNSEYKGLSKLAEARGWARKMVETNPQEVERIILASDLSNPEIANSFGHDVVDTVRRRHIQNFIDSSRIDIPSQSLPGMSTRSFDTAKLTNNWQTMNDSGAWKKLYTPKQWADLRDFAFGAKGIDAARLQSMDRSILASVAASDSPMQSNLINKIVSGDTMRNPQAIKVLKDKLGADWDIVKASTIRHLFGDGERVGFYQFKDKIAKNREQLSRILDKDELAQLDSFVRKYEFLSRNNAFKNTSNTARLGLASDDPAAQMMFAPDTGLTGQGNSLWDSIAGKAKDIVIKSALRVGTRGTFVKQTVSKEARDKAIARGEREFLGIPSKAETATQAVFSTMSKLIADQFAQAMATNRNFKVETK